MKLIKNISFLILLSFSIYLGTLAWNKINFPFNNQYQIIGNYSLNDASPLNDFFGYVIFIIIPIFFYFLWVSIIEKKDILNFFSNIKFKSENYNSYKIDNYLFYLILFFLFLEFFSTNFPSNTLDFFHEGQRLSAAYKSKIDNSLWKGSYITIGLFYEILGPKMIWKILGNESIGAIRFLDLFFILITKIILLTLALEISKNVKFEYLLKNLFFVILSCVFLSLIDYAPDTDNIKYREIPILLTVLLFFKFLNNFDRYKKNYFLLFCLAVVVVFSYFWSIDRAITQNLLTLFIIFYLIINRKFIDTFVLVSTVIILWILISIFLGNEFDFFLNNTISIFKESTLLSGYIHPIPFSDETSSSRATKTILSILFTILISLSLFLFSNNFLYKFKIYLLTISLVSFLSYAYALGRTDFTHLKQVFGFPLIFICTFFLYLIFNVLESVKKKNFLNFKFLNKYFSLFIIIILFSTQINLKNLISFNERFVRYINLDDKYFIDNSDLKFVKLYQKKFIKEYCISLFSNDVALLYLLRKPNCTKYYFTYTIGSLSNQNKQIQELESTKYIITGGKIDDTIKLFNWTVPLDERYPAIFNYINLNYEIYETIDNRNILKRLN